LSYDPTDLERATSLEILQVENKKKLSDALLMSSRISHTITEKQETEEQKKETLIPEPVKPARPDELLKPVEPVRPNEIARVETPKSVKDVYEQMLEETKKSSEQQLPGEKEKKGEEKQKESPSEKGDLGEIEKETANATIGIHKSFATESKDKFNYYMRIAEGFLKTGKYYNAVDAYTLASIYKPDNPLAYAGRSHALFASGEYMSSAYFLARAINIFPQYVDVKIDLNAMIPDANRLESRIEDVRQWISRTESAELNFLLAYIYYQLDRGDLAAEAIKSSAEKLPDVAAVKALKQAIEKKSR
jgi:tetratricopeptide (TPR) repeat protein